MKLVFKWDDYELHTSSQISWKSKIYERWSDEMSCISFISKLKLKIQEYTKIKNKNKFPTTTLNTTSFMEKKFKITLNFHV